jgi:hypothetical protein
MPLSALQQVREIQLYGALGSGEPCAYCDLDIPAGRAELRADSDLEGARVVLRFHPHCYQAWKKIQAEQ